MGRPMVGLAFCLLCLIGTAAAQDVDAPVVVPQHNSGGEGGGWGTIFSGLGLSRTQKTYGLRAAMPMQAAGETLKPVKIFSDNEIELYAACQAQVDSRPGVPTVARGLVYAQLKKVRADNPWWAYCSLDSNMHSPWGPMKADDRCLIYEDTVGNMLVGEAVRAAVKTAIMASSPEGTFGDGNSFEGGAVVSRDGRFLCLTSAATLTSLMSEGQQYCLFNGAAVYTPAASTMSVLGDAWNKATQQGAQLLGITSMFDKQ